MKVAASIGDRAVPGEMYTAFYGAFLKTGCVTVELVNAA